MVAVLYHKMALPNACHLGKRVPKKLFYENAQLNATDRRAFAENIDSIIWKYALEPSTVPIQPYEDGQREYVEIQVLQVNLRTLRLTKLIAEVIHRAIPYPLVIAFVYQTLSDEGLLAECLCSLSLAPKLLSQAEHGAIVVEEFLSTDWIDLSSLSAVDVEFLDSLALMYLPHTHLYAFYSALLDRVVALGCARLTGRYRIESTVQQGRERKDRLSASQNLKLQIAEYKRVLAKETQFNRKVELNMRIKQLKRQLQKLLDTL